MASDTASPHPMPAAESSKPRRHRRFRRRLRTRIILSFVLLGLGLTTLFAFLTQEARDRVENTLVEDLMNRNIDEFAMRYQLDPGRSPEVPFQQVRAFAYPKDKFDRVREERPEWAAYATGNYNVITRAHMDRM